jgi:predicted Fe-Mo cluster-binding NifX family protein
MRIAVSADNASGLDSPVSAHFGRCPYYVLVQVEDGDIRGAEAIENPYFSHHEPGQVPALIQQYGVDVMLTGGMGGRAVAIFQQYGIEPVSGATGSVRQAVEAYLDGTLRGAPPCNESVEHGHGRPPTG